MKVTLHEAHKIVKRIDKELGAGLDPSKNLNIYSDVNAGDWLDGKNSEVMDRVIVMENLIDARSTVRREIQKVNETSGLNDAIAEDARLQHKVRFLKRLIDDSRNRYDPEDQYDAVSLARQIEAARDSKSSYSNHITVNVVPAELVDSKTAEIKQLEKQIDVQKSKMIMLNHQTEITVNEIVADTLAQADLL